MISCVVAKFALSFRILVGGTEPSEVEHAVFCQEPRSSLAGGQVQSEQPQNFLALLSPLSHSAALPSGTSQ